MDEPYRNLLIVEAEPAILAWLQSCLQGSDWAIRSAGSAERAIEMVDAEPDWPEVAFVDLDLPDRGGARWLSRLRSSAPGLRIVATSGRLPARMRDALRRAEVEFLPKPFRFDEFDAAIEHPTCRPV